MPVADVIVDRIVTQSLRVARFEAGTRRKVRGLLRDVEADVLAQLLRRDPTGVTSQKFRDRRLRALREQIRQSLNSSYRAIGTAMNEDLRALSIVESGFATQSINGAIGAQVLSTEIAPALARSLVSGLTVQGAPSREWWATQSRTLERKFSTQVRLGMASGEGIGDISRRIRGTRANGFADGIMQTSRREADALVRTSVQTLSNNARMETFRANSDVVKGMQTVTTLDEKTTDICIALTGASWDLDGKPLPESAWQGDQPPGPPFHWNCRTTMAAVLRSFEEIANLSPAKARAIEKSAPDFAKASMDGQLAKDITFDKFLKGKSVSFQNAQLGKTRAGLWRDGRLPLNKLIDQSARPLSVAGLRKSVKGVTQKAVTAAKAGEL